MSPGGFRPGQSLQLGKPLCDRKGGGTECPPSGGYRLDSGAAFVLAPPVHVCVSVQIGVCVCMCRVILEGPFVVLEIILIEPYSLISRFSV